MVWDKHRETWVELPEPPTPATVPPRDVAAEASRGVADTAFALEDHAHGHGSHSDPGMHALATVDAPGFMPEAHYALCANAVDESAGEPDGGKLLKLNPLGEVAASCLPAVSSAQPGILSATDYIDVMNMRLPPAGRITRWWVPNANLTTYDDRGWGATVWGTPGAQPIANAAATRFARIRYTTGATTNAGAGVSGSLSVQRSASTSARIGGFRLTSRFRLNALAASNQWFYVGLYASGTWTGATLPSSIANNCGFFFRAGALNFLSVSATAATQTPIAGYALALLQAGAEIYIEAPEQNTAQVFWGIRGLDDAAYTEGIATVNLPTAGTPMGPMTAVSVSTTLSAASFELGVQTLHTRW